MNDPHRNRGGYHGEKGNRRAKMEDGEENETMRHIRAEVGMLRRLSSKRT